MEQNTGENQINARYVIITYLLLHSLLFYWLENHDTQEVLRDELEQKERLLPSLQLQEDPE